MSAVVTVAGTPYVRLDDDHMIVNRAEVTRVQAVLRQLVLLMLIAERAVDPEQTAEEARLAHAMLDEHFPNYFGRVDETEPPDA